MFIPAPQADPRRAQQSRLVARGNPGNLGGNDERIMAMTTQDRPTDSALRKHVFEV